MANGDTDQNPGEEDASRYDLYSEEEEQEIFDKIEELALAGELDDDSYRVLLDDYGLTPEDFTPPVNVGGLYDDGYDLGRTDPPPDDSGSFDNSDDFLNASNPNVSDREGANLGGIFEGNSGGEDGGGSVGSGSIYTPTTTTVSEEPMVTGGGTPVELNTDGTPVTDTSAVSDIYDVSGTTPTNLTPGGGGGSVEFEVSPGVYIPIPEGTIGLATELLQRGVPIASLLDEINKEKNLNVSTVDNTIVPDPNTIVTPVDNTVVTPVNNTTLTNTDMTDAELNGLEEDPNFTGEFEGQQYNNGMLVSSDSLGDLSSSSATDVTTGPVSTDVTTGPVSTDVSTGQVSTDVSSKGGDGGNVTVNIGEGTGGSNAGYEKFFEMINSYIASGEPIEEGEVKGIYEQFIETSPQSAEAIRSFLALDRPVSEDQAELKTDIYKDVIGDVREAQSPLMKSLTRRSEMQGAEAERLMGPLSFLEDRDATQAGYGQAVSGGRGLGNISGMLAGRERAEQKNVNLQLSGNLLGQQRATAGLMAGIESGIYGQMAPDIGLDFGSLLGISGVDVQNKLGERQSTRAANAAERGANIKLGIEAAPAVIGGIKTGFDWLKGLGN